MKTSITTLPAGHPMPRLQTYYYVPHALVPPLSFVSSLLEKAAAIVMVVQGLLNLRLQTLDVTVHPIILILSV